MTSGTNFPSLYVLLSCIAGGVDGFISGKVFAGCDLDITRPFLKHLRNLLPGRITVSGVSYIAIGTAHQQVLFADANYHVPGILVKLG